jgi:deoxyhypusine synthase
MSKDYLDALVATGANVSITMTPSELRDFAEDIARSVAERMSAQTVDAIKDAMGDSMKYCTTEEAVRDFGIKLPTLKSWVAKKVVIPLKRGGKNIYKREDLVRLTQKKID